MKKIFVFLFLIHCFWAVSLPIKTLIVTKGAQDVAQGEQVISDVLSAENKKKLQEFIGKEISEKSLQMIRESVLACLNAQGEYALKAFFPEQDVSSGDIWLQIVVPKIEKFEVKGNRWEKEEFYQKRLSLESGEPLQTSQILNEVAWLNRNPFRYAEVVVAPGKVSDSVGVDLLVKDRFALRPFVGADNTGTNLTNMARLFAGVTWGKPFGRADVMTYQYTAAPNPSRFSSHSGSYQLFLPWKHEMMVSCGYSVTHPDVEGFSHEAINVQSSLRYVIPFQPLYTETKQAITLGIDYKNLNSNVFYIEESPAVAVSQHQVNLSQLYIGYLWKRTLVANIELFISPAPLLPNQTEERYRALRSESTVLYGYGKALLKDSYGEMFSWMFRAQAATGPLLPSEQFGLGGIGTVRGYPERRFNADNAICMNGEFSPLKTSFFKHGRLIVSTFSDFGYGFNYHVEDLAQASQYLWSVGLAASCHISTYASLQADYGVQLHHLYQDTTFGRLHMSAVVSF